MKHTPLYFVVSLTGASVLALEILGLRVLGPFYGASLFLGSALVAATLAALAAGCALGGRWADHGARPGRLSIVLAVAGLWVIVIPWLRAPLLAATESWGPRAAVLVASFVLFFPPLALVGVTVPYAIRLAARSPDEVGRVAGNLLAFSALAGVAAALLTGFVLVPSLGVTRVFLLVGAALFVASAIAQTGARRLGPMGVLTVVAVSELLRWHEARPLPAEVRVLRQTPFAELRVVDHRGERFLLLDGDIRTRVRIEDAGPHQDRIPVLELAADLFERPGRALLVGLGGGPLARALAFDNWRVDAVEIDPAVVAVAREHFRLRPAFATVHVADGRRFLRGSRDSFDLIVLDAGGGGAVPCRLLTAEAFGEAKARLRPGGVLAVGLEGIGWTEPLARAAAATLGTRFRNVVALPTAEPPDRFGDIVLYASDRAMEIPRERLGDPVATLSDDEEHWRVLERMHGWDNRFAPKGGRVLTDDWNPADLRWEEIHRAARRETRSTLPASVLGW